MCRVASLSGTLTERKSARNSSSSPTSSPELGRDRGVLVGVVGDEAHAEGPGEPEHLGADVAHAELAQRLADQALAHVLRALCPALGPWRHSRSLIRSFCVRARMKVRIETATGRRTPSGVITRAMPASVQAWTSTLS